ncbi:MAG TPA: hypothetical protein VKA34_13355 [Balneolales bacterium]|nr:hypothetical protein [Balneolales bacterium]
MDKSDPTNFKFRLHTNSQDQFLELSGFELFEKGSFSCKLKIRSRGFGIEKTEYFDNISDFIDQIETMNTTLTGQAIIRENYHDHYIKFEITKTGHVIVSGHLFEYSQHKQELLFEFKTDQTCLEPFIQDLKQVFKVGS